ncbi:unnamed protein product, partial [Hapterophycus canaliculatus]
GPVWTVKFNVRGTRIATGGQDGKVVVWDLSGSTTTTAEAPETSLGRGTMQVLSSTPARVFEGHKSDVVDLSWSHSDFLCSASIDHTVMLWHPVRWE